MNRSTLREEVFRLLFQIEFYPEQEIGRQADLYMGELEELFTEEELLSIRGRFESILLKKTDIDELLNNKTSGWSTDRMGKTELAILRLAVYEIRFDNDIPTAVAINEAVELAKKYGQEESAPFVNGVLAHFADNNSITTD